MEEINKTLQFDATGQETLFALLAHHNKTKASEALGISRNALYDRIEKYQLNKIIESIPQKAIQTLQLGSEKAAQILVDALDSYKERLKAANSILDRVGLTAAKPIEPPTDRPIPILDTMSVECVLDEKFSNSTKEVIKT